MSHPVYLTVYKCFTLYNWIRPLDNAEYNPLRRQYLDGSLFHGGGVSHGGLRGLE